MATLAIAVLTTTSCQQGKYDYSTVDGDPLQAKMYTLPNGLKVYMTINKEQPRIQTYIAVHAGSKHEPAETTGLAHYLEHMLFKGSTNFGTTDYEAEKPLLDEIRDLYEVYRQTTDEAERKAIYHRIDSVSYLASGYFIPNEYDKLMSHIGSDGSNAYTSNDQTVYVEDIPSNEIENWAKVQSDRFKNMVLRGFHTELETVYEEYNKYLNSDWDKVSTAVTTTLTPTHPYNHSVIGYGDHLKNPSIKNIEEFFHKYYVPNNMAICLSGDFDPDNMIDIITKYFGDMEPNKELAAPTIEAQPELTHPVEKEVMTQNPECLLLSWRFDGAASHQNDTLDVMTQILHNGKAGLFDLNLNLPHKVVESQAFSVEYCDYTFFYIYATPLPGQTLEQLKDLVLAENDKLRKGEFDEQLVQSVITEKKLQLQHSLEENSSRADMFVEAFVHDKDWKDAVEKNNRISRLTKKDILDFANRHLRADNYVCVYKRTGKDSNDKPVAKPAITPIRMNRDTVSTFAKEVMEAEVTPIEPVFVNLDKDITKLQSKNEIPILYRHNSLNDLFSLTFRYEMGITAATGDNSCRYLSLASDYFDYIGTDSLTAQEIQQKMYLLGCTMRMYTDTRNTFLTLSGLSENMQEALRLMEHFIDCAKPDSLALQNLVISTLKERSNRLESFDYYPSLGNAFLRYGAEGSHPNLSDEELKNADCDLLTSIIHEMPHFAHRITYYGPMESEEVVDIINRGHKTPEQLLPVGKNLMPAFIKADEDVCFLIPYSGTKSFVMSQFASNGKPFDASLLGLTEMFNNYFGSGMNSIVFQEMREKRSLCYGSAAAYIQPYRKDETCSFRTYIQSQNDKMNDCIEAFREIIGDMPLSNTSFQVAKQGLITQMRTQRTTREGFFSKYFEAEELGIGYDPDSLCFVQLQDITLDDIARFKKENVDGIKYRTLIVGDPAGLNAKDMETLGKVSVVPAREAFGY